MKIAMEVEAEVVMLEVFHKVKLEVIGMDLGMREDTTRTMLGIVYKSYKLSTQRWFWYCC